MMQYDGFRLKKEGPSCDEQISIEDLDFIAGDVVRRSLAVGETLDSYKAFSEHHANQLIKRADELPRFFDNTGIVFPGTVYVPVEEVEEIEKMIFVPCITYCETGLLMGLIVLSETLNERFRFPYLLHTRR